MITDLDREAYEALPSHIKDLVERVWTSKLADAQCEAYYEGFDQASIQERRHRADELCERCGSDVSACFNCITRIIVGALPPPPPDTTK